MRPTLALGLATAAVLSSSCGLTLVTGNGTLVTEPRTVGAFSKLEVSDAFTATAALGTRAVSITVDQNVLPYVRVVVEGDTLKVGLQDGVGVTTAHLAVVVTNDAFQGLAASGAAKVTAVATPATSFPVTASGASTVLVSGLSSSTLTVDASGASTVTVSGAAATGTLAASGASLVDTRLTPLTTASLDCSGASTIRARVAQSVSGTASGASVVQISGAATSTVVASGGSTVSLGQP